MRCAKSNRTCRYGQSADRRHATGAASSTPGETSVQINDLIETPGDSIQRQHSIPCQDSIPRQGNDQSLASLTSPDAAFSTTPLAFSQIPLLNISPFEWYDLLARDAISNIQRLNEASAGEPRWNLPAITLSRRQSPSPECPGPHLDQARAISEQRTSLVGCPWNTNAGIELSPADLIFLRYYTEAVGPILDLFDPARHFTNVVPHLGLQNTGLLKSILAVGAKHMSLGLANEDPSLNAQHSPLSQPATTHPDPNPTHAAAQYYYETLQYLSQTLLYPSYADSREILATSIMISTYEMFDADRASTSGDWERHLRGSFWIQRSQDNDGESADGLRRAVWWAWLRQDIWAAFQARRPTLTIWRARKPLEELDEDELATRIVYICAKCVEFAAGGADENQNPSPDSNPDLNTNTNPQCRIEQGDRLLRALEDWFRVLPMSYRPVTVHDNRILSTTAPDSSHPNWNGMAQAQEPGQNTIFPPVWIHPASHAGAVQMYHFAKAVVLLNQPTMGGLNAYCRREKQLSESVQTVCGIANACQEHDSAVAFVSVQTLFCGK